MKIFILMVMVGFGFVGNVSAMIMPVDFTGNYVEHPADCPLGSSKDLRPRRLGGPVGNQYWMERADEFTVDEIMEVNSLYVFGSQLPVIYDEFGSNSLKYELPQSMAVSFNLYEGSLPFRLETTANHWMPDFDNLLESVDYTFSTDDGHTTDYFNIEIPFFARLEPGKNYWIEAVDPIFSGTSLFYTTEFYSDTPLPVTVTPEPLTLALFAAGLFMTLGVNWRGLQKV